MKKLIFILVIGVFPMMSFAGFNAGNGRACAVDTDGGTDWFWYCGDQTTKCAGTEKWSGDHYTWIAGAENYGVEPPVCNGDPDKCSNWATRAMYWEGQKLACCGGGAHTSGIFRRYYSWLTEAKKEFENGYCVYWKNPCGTAFTSSTGATKGDCGDEPTACNDGFILRKAKTYKEGKDAFVNKCVEPCPAGTSFVNEFSAECAECETSKQKGIDSNNVCIQCASDEFFKPNTDCVGSDCCIKKNSLAHSSKEDMRACFRCPQEPEILSRCFNGERTDDIKEKCRFK